MFSTISEKKEIAFVCINFLFLNVQIFFFLMLVKKDSCLHSLVSTFSFCTQMSCSLTYFPFFIYLFCFVVVINSVAKKKEVDTPLCRAKQVGLMLSLFPALSVALFINMIIPLSLLFEGLGNFWQ